jgi:hypothetical protein
MGDYAARLHSCKYCWLHAPVTNISGSRYAVPASSGF